jgi:hypothetical protein
MICASPPPRCISRTRTDPGRWIVPGRWRRSLDALLKGPGATDPLLDRPWHNTARAANTRAPALRRPCPGRMERRSAAARLSACCCAVGGVSPYQCRARLIRRRVLTRLPVALGAWCPNQPGAPARMFGCTSGGRGAGSGRAGGVFRSADAFAGRWSDRAHDLGHAGHLLHRSRVQCLASAG